MATFNYFLFFFGIGLVAIGIGLAVLAVITGIELPIAFGLFVLIGIVLTWIGNRRVNRMKAK